MSIFVLVRRVFPILLASIWVLGAHQEVRAEKEPAGLAVFKAQKCAKCHTLDAYKIGKLPKTDAAKDEEDSEEDGGDDPEIPDLSKLSDDVLKSPNPEDYLRKFLKKNLKRDGKKHKQRFKGSEEDYTALIRFLLETGGQKK